MNVPTSTRVHRVQDMNFRDACEINVNFHDFIFLNAKKVKVFQFLLKQEMT